MAEPLLGLLTAIVLGVLASLLGDGLDGRLDHEILGSIPRAEGGKRSREHEEDRRARDHARASLTNPVRTRKGLRHPGETCPGQLYSKS